MVITEIKQPITIKGRRYQRYIGEDNLPYLTTCRFPFPVGAQLSIETDDRFGTQEVPQEMAGTPRAVEAYLEYYKSRIVKTVKPLCLNEDTQIRYTLYERLRQYLTPKSAMYFLETYSVQILQERLELDPYWFYAPRHGLEEENFSRINRQTVVSTFAMRQSQLIAAMQSLFRSNERKGNTWMHIDRLYQNLCYRMQMDRHLPPSKELTEAVLLSDQSFYFDGVHAATMAAYRTECEIGEDVKLLLHMHPVFREQIRFSERLCEEQRAAVNGIVNDGNISILTGGPGCGKTTVIADLLCQYLGRMEVALLAPTGRAVQRMRQSLLDEFSSEQLEGATISTIHKFLGYGLPAFAKTQRLTDTKRVKLCIVDESSMVDIFLFAELLRALDLTTCKLILVGDKNQLPSIHAGNVLTDLIACGVPTYYLKENHRSIRSIFDNGQMILAGERQPFRCDEHFRFLPADRLEEILSLVDFSSMNVILLSPYRKPYDANGNPVKGNITDLNRRLHMQRFGCEDYCVGDKVMCIKNNYAKGCFNGDIGRLVAIAEDGYHVQFDEARVIPLEREEMEFAYASTIHRAQGCEYPRVYIYLPDDMPQGLLVKELLYTAVTRAREYVTILGNEQTMYEIMQICASERQTFLSTAPRLIGGER